MSINKTNQSVAQSDQKVNGTSCIYKQKKMIGVIAAVIASVMVIFSVVLATGIFGGGPMAFAASGLAFGSIFFFSSTAYLLFPKMN